MLLAGAINLPDRANPIGNGCLVFGGIARVNALCEIGHLHGQNKDGDRDSGKNTDNEGIHIKKLLVPTQLTAPEGMKLDSSGSVPGGGGRLYNISQQ